MMDPEAEARLLSRLLFEAREHSEMFADVVEASTGKPDTWGRRLVSEIDAYRAERGWSPNGYGDESGVTRRQGADGCMHTRFVAECLDCGASPLEGLR